MTSIDDNERDLAAGHALNSLSEVERRAADEHARTSEQFAAELAGFREAAAALADLAEPVAPPDSLREQLFARLDDLPAAEIVSSPESSRRRRLLLGLSAVAAAAAVVAASLVASATLGRDPSMVERITAAADAERVVAEMDDGSGRVEAVWSESLERAVLVIDRMEALPDGLVYQAWIIDDTGYAAPDDVFTASTDVIALIGEFRPGFSIGITIEPTGGSPEPTTTPIVVIPTA